MTKITDAEWQIMSQLWKNQPQTITQLTKALEGSMKWSKYTIITYLKRMEEKGLVSHTEGERAKLYFAAVTQQEAVLQEKDHFLNKVFRGNAGLMVSTLLQQSDFTPEELQYLEKILTQKKK